MTRQDYIKLRRDNNIYEILLNYFRERTTLGIGQTMFLDSNLFTHTLNIWVNGLVNQSINEGRPVSRDVILNSFAESCINYYDKHFSIIIITVEKEIKKKVIQQFIL